MAVQFGSYHGCKRAPEGLEDASLAQAIEAFPLAVPMTEALRQSAPATVSTVKK